jgi:hypothetical protein
VAVQHTGSKLLAYSYTVLSLQTGAVWLTLNTETTPRNSILVLVFIAAHVVLLSFTSHAIVIALKIEVLCKQRKVVAVAKEPRDVFI